jgi:hypothetical protein
VRIAGGGGRPGRYPRRAAGQGQGDRFGQELDPDVPPGRAE